MEFKNLDSGLGEALASYQPTSMTDEVWDRFRDDAVELVSHLGYADARAAKPCLARLVVFLADLAANRPEATLGDLLTRDQVQGYLDRCLASGEAEGTVQNKQGSLNALLRAKEGGRPRSRRATGSPPDRSAAPPLEPYPFELVERVMTAALTDGSADALDLARVVACGLAGHPLPGRNQTVLLGTDPASGTVTVDGRSRTVPAVIGLPPGGLIDGRTIERGRGWARNVAGFVLDRRRLELTWITHVVSTRPALTALQLPGVGRRALTAAVRAAPRPDDHDRKELLRGG